MRAFRCCFPGSKKNKEEKATNIFTAVGYLPQPSPQSQHLRLEGSTDHPIVLREGWLKCKSTLIEGRRAADRSWKRVWGELRAPNFNIYQQRKGSPLELFCQLDMRACKAKEANYIKRKNVLCINSPNRSQILIKAGKTANMILWLDTLKHPEGFTGDEQQASSEIDITPCMSQVSIPDNHLCPETSNKDVTQFPTLKPGEKSVYTDEELPFGEVVDKYDQSLLETSDMLLCLGTLKHLEGCTGDEHQASPEIEITSCMSQVSIADNHICPQTSSKEVKEFPTFTTGVKCLDTDEVLTFGEMVVKIDQTLVDTYSRVTAEITEQAGTENVSITPCLEEHYQKSDLSKDIYLEKYNIRIPNQDGTIVTYSQLSSRLLEVLKNIPQYKDPMWLQRNLAHEKYNPLKLSEKDKSRILTQWENEKQKMYRDFWEDD